MSVCFFITQYVLNFSEFSFAANFAFMIKSLFMNITGLTAYNKSDPNKSLRFKRRKSCVIMQYIANRYFYYVKCQFEQIWVL